MRNKMLFILAAIIILFGALYFVIDYKNKQAIGDSSNPYGKDNLEQATIDQLNDPLYQNQITPEKLDKELKSSEDLTVYFYSPTCIHCQNTTPVLVPIADEFNVDLKKMNLLEFDNKWNHYNIDGTPTLIHYKNGIEVDRISGEQPKEIFQGFFEEHIGE